MTQCICMCSLVSSVSIVTWQFRNRERGPVSHLQYSQVRHGLERSADCLGSIHNKPSDSSETWWLAIWPCTCHSLQSLLGIFYPGSYIPWIPLAAGRSANCLIGQAPSENSKTEMVGAPTCCDWWFPLFRLHPAASSSYWSMWRMCLWVKMEHGASQIW